MGVFGGGVFGEGVFGSLTALSSVVQDVYPDRVLLTASNLLYGQVVSITRRPAGSTTLTPVRGADDLDIAISDAIVVADTEPPYGIELTWTLTVDDLDLDTEVRTLTLEGGLVALTDSISGDSAEVTIMGWPEKRWERSGSVFPVGGRNIVVSGQVGGFTGTIELYTETDDAKNNVLDLVRNATSGIIQIRQSGGYDGVNCYVAVLAVTEARWSQDGSDPRRLITLDAVEVAGWAPGLAASTFTLGDAEAAYTGQTLLDAQGDFATLLDAQIADFSA